MIHSAKDKKRSTCSACKSGPKDASAIGNNDGEKILSPQLAAIEVHFVIRLDGIANGISQ